MTPAALSILMTTFQEGRERNTALGIWGAVGASGGTIGVLLGGILTDTIGWEWIFFLNVPVALAVIVLAPALLRESRAAPTERRFDLAGALSVTAGIAVLVYGLVEANDAGWGSVQTISLFAASAALLAVFAVVELRTRAPIMPFSIFRIRAVTGSNLAGLALGGAVFGMIFVLTLYMQQVLGYTPLETGLAWLAMSLTALLSSIIGSALVTRIGTRAPLIAGLLVSAVGLVLLSRISAGGSYAGDLLPGLLVVGSGLGLAFVAVSIGALEGVRERDAGLASGLVNTTQQVGGALGVGVLSTAAISRSDELLASGSSAPVALTEGFQIALLVAAGFAAAGAVAALAFIRRSGRGAEQVEGAADTGALPAAEARAR
jgi:EmrB/QacA subfamily drug resistance transporter